MKKKLFIRGLALFLAFVLAGCGAGNTDPGGTVSNTPVAQNTQPTPQETVPTQPTETTLPPDPYDLLTDHQRNILAMYNHLAVVTQEINDNSNGRMFLEEVYSTLVGNVNPEIVDDTTNRYFQGLLNTIEKYRLNNVKRERIQYIFEENKAAVLLHIVPDPASILSNAAEKDVAGLANATIGSIGSYPYSVHLLEQEYLKDGWELDDEQKAALHESRKNLFGYLLETVQQGEIPGYMTLSEAAVKDFVRWSSEDNVHQRIQFFESELETYKYYAGYWRELVSCYYEVGEYEKCLLAMEEYEHIREDLFRQDFYFAQTIPLALVAAHEHYDTETYIPVAEQYLDLLTKNALNSDWSVRYFAAQMYIDLYSKVGDTAYLNTALDIVVNNVNSLIQQQRTLNANYINQVKEIDESEEAESGGMDLIGGFMDYLNNLRSVELPPVYEPLTINCDLLFALAEELDIPKDEQQRIERILRGNGDPLFLSDALEAKYSFASGDLFFTAEFQKDALVLPVSCVSENSIIRISATTDGTTTVYENWTVKKVDRPSADFASFVVTYTNEEIKEQAWNADSTVTVEIVVDAAYPDNVVVLRFEVSKFVDMWVVSDIVEFAQITN